MHSFRVLITIMICSIGAYVYAGEQEGAEGVASTEKVQSSNSAAPPLVSQARIWEKQKQYEYRAWLSRWIWRSTEGAVAVGAITAFALHMYKKTGAASSDSLQQSPDNYDVAEKRVRTGESFDASQDDTMSTVKYMLSWDFWKPTLGKVGKSLISQAQSATYGLVSMSPIWIYRGIVKPVYLTDISSFVSSYTTFHQLVMRLSVLAQNDFSKFQRNRKDLVAALVYDVESILAFLQAARGYLDPSLDQYIKWVYDDIMTQVQTFLQTAYVNEQEVVYSAIQRLQRVVQSEIAM